MFPNTQSVFSHNLTQLWPGTDWTEVLRYKSQMRRMKAKVVCPEYKRIVYIWSFIIQLLLLLLQDQDQVSPKIHSKADLSKNVGKHVKNNILANTMFLETPALEWKFMEIFLPTLKIQYIFWWHFLYLSLFVSVTFTSLEWS